MISGPLKPQSEAEEQEGVTGSGKELLVLSVLLSEQGGRDHRQGLRQRQQTEWVFPKTLKKEGTSLWVSPSEAKPNSCRAGK